MAVRVICFNKTVIARPTPSYQGTPYAYSGTADDWTYDTDYGLQRSPLKIVHGRPYGERIQLPKKIVFPSNKKKSGFMEFTGHNCETVDELERFADRHSSPYFKFTVVDSDFDTTTEA